MDVAQAALEVAEPMPVKQEQLVPPKVFVSHASEDKDRFVLPFAIKLREQGIDAWVDRWEMLPGDSIVRKIFDEGLEDAQAVIVVVSRYSVDKPWVREEIDAAFVRRVESKSKLIPVVIDECDVPPVLKTIVWEKIGDLQNYDAEFKRIVMAVFGTSDKPPLGKPPTYATTVIDTLPGLTPVDSMVMRAIGDAKMASPHIAPSPEALYTQLAGTDIDVEALLDALEVLENHRYIETTRTMMRENRGIFGVRATYYGFDQYARTYLSDYPDAVKAVGLALVNTDIRDFGQLALAVGKPQVLVEHILEGMAHRRLVEVTKHSMGGYVMEVSPEVRRTFQQ